MVSFVARLASTDSLVDLPMPSQAEIDAGQAVYTRRNLALYDWLVHGVSNRWIWRCPTRRLVELYETHASNNHLDLGVGTGLLLQRAQLTPETRLVLVDLNENCLALTAERLARQRPTTYVRNVLEPLELSVETKFESAGLNYLLHCLPGSLREKAVVFDHVAEYLAPGGVLFGSTLLADDVKRNAAARALMRFYNRKGIFSNANDSRDDLSSALASRFVDSHVEVAGCAALFWARMSG